MELFQNKKLRHYHYEIISTLVKGFLLNNYFINYFNIHERQQ